MIRTTKFRSRKRGIWMKVRDAEAIRRWRKRAGFTQAELGLLCKCTQQAIQQIETGALKGITEDLALTIARRLNVPWEDLFSAHDANVMPKQVTSTSTDKSNRRSA